MKADRGDEGKKDQKKGRKRQQVIVTLNILGKINLMGTGVRNTKGAGGRK